MELTRIFGLAIGLLSLLTNGVLLYILLRDPLKCFKASTTYFIVCLSFSDLLTGTNACFWGMDEFLVLSTDHHEYLLSLFWVTTQVSFLTLLAMSVERFLIVKYPIYSRVWITKRRVSCAIACIWCVSATLGGLILLPPAHVPYVQLAIFCEFFLSVFVITGLYTLILFGVRTSRRDVKSTGQLHKGGEDHASSITNTRARAQKASAFRRISTGRKHTCGIKITITEDSNGRATKALLPICPGSPGMQTVHRNDTRNNEALGEDVANGNKCPTGKKFERGQSAEDTKIRKDSEEFPDLEEVSSGNRPRRKFIEVAHKLLRAKEKTRRTQQDKLTAVVLLLVGILALTVLPYLLASQILLGYLIAGKCKPPEILVQFVQYYFPVELLNFAVNPLVYAWRLPQYRRSLRYLCSKRQPYSDVSQAWASFRSGSMRMRREQTSQ